MKMPKTGRFPLLETEPKSVKGGYHLGVAPPPYRSSSSFNFHEEDSASALWSEHSYNSGQGSGTTSGVGTGSTSIGKRRASWTNLVDADENLNKYKVNAYPKVASTASSASLLPQKYPIRTHHNTSSTSNANYFSGLSNGFLSHTMPSTRGPLLASRENSLTPSVISDTFVYPKGSIYNYKLNESGPTMSPAGSVRERVVLDPDPSQPPRVKKDRMESLRRIWQKPISKLLCLGLLLLLMAAIIVAIVLSQVLVLPRHFQFSWTAPQIIAKNTTANIVMDVSGEQARFDLTGDQSPLFKNNYVSVVDFKSNKVAIVDSALRASGGGIRNIVCFITDLNRQNIPDLTALQTAAKNSESRKAQNQGWADSWTFTTTPLNGDGNQFFQPPIPECNGSRWIQLVFTSSNQKNARCSECYDFCLPEYGIERDVLRDETYLNIARRDCFYLFVPEWRNFAIGYTNAPQTQFGQSQFVQQQNAMLANGWPINQQNMNQQNPNYGFNNPGISSNINSNNNFNNNPNNNQSSSQNLETRWIPLQTVPQQVANATEQAFNQFRQNFNQWGQNLGQNPDQTQLNIAGQVVQNGQRTFSPDRPYGQITNYQFTTAGENAQNAAANLGLLGSNYNSPLQPPQTYQPQGLDLMNSLNQGNPNNPNTQSNPFASNPFPNSPNSFNQNNNPSSSFNTNGFRNQPQPVPQTFISNPGLTTFGGADMNQQPPNNNNPIVYPQSQQNLQNSQQAQNRPLNEILAQPNSLTQQTIGTQQQAGQQPPSGYLGNPAWNNVGK
uniref:Uncharacterized protein n=2 Tax=Acrobeloides nanus TaxID=290746 RepID=A0A914DTL0_9BILA